LSNNRPSLCVAYVGDSLDQICFLRRTQSLAYSAVKNASWQRWLVDGKLAPSAGRASTYRRLHLGECFISLLVTK